MGGFHKPDASKPAFCAVSEPVRRADAMAFGFETVGARSGGKDNNFNLIRAIAAICVLIAHAYPLSSGQEGPLSGFFRVDHTGDDLGRFAVFVFFGISGFYITRSFEMGSSVWRFCRARLLRLYPGLVVMAVVVFLAMVYLGGNPDRAEMLAAFPSYFFNVVTFRIPFFLGLTGDPGELPGVLAGVPTAGITNGSLWSLTFEVICYGGVAVVGVLGILRRRWVFVAGVALVIAGFLVVYPDERAGYFLSRILYCGLPFAIGMLIWVFRDRVPLTVFLAVGLSVLAVAAKETVLFRPAVILALIYWTFYLGFARIPRLLAYNRMGDYSYGIYIYAFPIQQLAARYGADTPFENILVALPVTLLCAAMSWHLVEQPFMRSTGRAGLIRDWIAALYPLRRRTY